MKYNISEDFWIDEKYKQLFISASGGADSTIVLYAIIKFLQQHNRIDTKIHINTVLFHHYDSYGGSTLKTASNVVSKIIELTNAFDLINSHEFYFRGNAEGFYDRYGRYIVHRVHPTSKTRTEDNKANAPCDASRYWLMELSNRIIQRPDKDQCLLISGQNKNPPAGAVVTSPLGKSIELRRSSPHQHRNDNDNKWVLDNRGVHGFFPIIAADKKDVIELYRHFGVYESLLPLTFSCATWDPINTVNFTKPCGECWWCLERQWGME